MNKPNWKDAPQWAQWLAMDSDGCWYWYEKEPDVDCAGSWFNAGLARIEHAVDEQGIDSDPILEKRP